MRALPTPLLFLLLALIAGCDQRQKRLPRAVGGEGEILVVMGKAHWEGAPGAAVRALLERPIDRMPQREPMYKVAHTTPGAFGQLLSTHHNVLQAVIGAEADTNAVMLRRDPFAIGQLLIRVSNRDPQEWINTLERHSDELMAQFATHQRGRVEQRLQREQDASLSNTLNEAHGLRLTVPMGYRVVEQTQDMAWLQRDRVMSGSGLEHNVIEGILVYHYPYTSDSTFNVEYLVDVRDSVTREHVQGPVEGSHMIVQRGFQEMDLMPASRPVQVNGRWGYLMHGLFGMEGAKMGGPFVSLTTIDEARGRVVTVEGFVYAPQFDKREYMRELEAILFTLKIDPAAR